MNLDDALALTGLHGLKQADTQNALGVTDGTHRGVGGRVDAGAGQGGQGRVLGHEDAGHGDVGAVGGGAVLRGDRCGIVVQEPRAARVTVSRSVDTGARRSATAWSTATTSAARAWSRETRSASVWRQGVACPPKVMM